MFAKTYLRLLLASLVTGSAAQAASVGPPLICHPIDIGKAESLPFGDAKFAVRHDFPLERVHPEAMRFLDGSDDVLVHMETIRRAVIYLAEGESRSKKVGRVDLTRAFLADLDLRADEAARVEPGSTGAGSAALRIFDRAYAVEAFRQMGTKAEGNVEKGLEAAIARRPNDPALRFGVALATFGDHRGGKSRIFLENLQKALAGAEDPEGLLRKNLVSTVGAFLGCESYEALLGETRTRLARL